MILVIFGGFVNREMEVVRGRIFQWREWGQCTG